MPSPRDGGRWSRAAIVALAAFAAVSAIGGGLALVLSPPGTSALPDHDLLDDTPFASFAVPGVLLGAVVGGTSIACAVLTWRRSRAAIDATILAGGALAAWIVAEIAMIRTPSWLQLVYGGLGFALLALGAAWALRSGSARHRWIVYVTAAETLGFLAPALAGIGTVRAGLSPAPQAFVLTAAGFVEGFALGTGQARALPFRIHRLRFAALTGAGAAVVWGGVMAMMALPASSTVAPVIALVGLGAIGTAQWFELRHHGVHAGSWIGWTALAWLIAMPLSFAPGPFVDDTTPIANNLALWAVGGALMAYVMATITWQAAKRAMQAHGEPAVAHA